jgi:hypothetical protein
MLNARSLYVATIENDSRGCRLYAGRDQRIIRRVAGMYALIKTVLDYARTPEEIKTNLGLTPSGRGYSVRLGTKGKSKKWPKETQ